MDLTSAACYRAIASKDPRFDGRFFTAVLTTGVYCRPVCPARVPLRRNVRFYPSAAAAEAAGFRPCLRCRPESSPGTPAWLGTSATVSRALRHIESGALDREGLDALAARLGVGERHLRRLFVEHVGAAPLAVAQTRRVQLAKKLIDETALPMTRIALDAGFPSVRRFNATIARIYGRTPSDLRRRAPGRSTREHGGPEEGRPLRLQLAYRPPFDWRRLADYLGPRAIPGVEHVEDGLYRRALRCGDAEGIVEVRPVTGRPALELRVPAALAGHLVSIVHGARRVFDLGADPREIVTCLRRDPALAAMLGRRRDVRVPGAWDAFELATRAILGQQISVRAATTLAGRLARGHGAPLACPEGPITHTFPGPAALAGADLVAAGLTGSRARTLTHLAGRVIAEPRLLDAPAALEGAIGRLTALPGIGPWTAHYIAMRALSEPDAFPAGDLGLRKAMADEEGTLPTEDALARRSESWRPWRAYAAMLMWTR
jgi:AraC family transcriptional regulator of adaptative response / DNA-3-methyladenine glycosylase II